MNLHLTDDRSWRLNVFGGFSLVDSGGNKVRLPDRKTEGLLAVLVVERDLGISRQDAANILWPGREPANLANLRQALAVLRRYLGAEAIESSAAHCRLASGFALQSDYESIELRSSGAFMPGHEGEWFDDVRLTGDPSEDLTVVDHYLRSLQWLADFDPRTVHAILAAAPGMARSLPFCEFSVILEKTKGTNPPAGWQAFWLGTVKSNLAECKELLRFALKEARRENDLVLASEVCLELGRAYSRTGHLDRAMKICRIADDIAERTGTREAKRNALRLSGTVQFQWHDPEKGDAILRRLESEVESPLELASITNTRAFFEVSMGWYDRAETAHKQALGIARESGHFRIGILSEAISTHLLAAAGKRAEAIGRLVEHAAKHYANDTVQFGVYSEELAARLSFLEGDKAFAAKTLRSAQRERLRAGMFMTPLEQRRVASVR